MDKIERYLSHVSCSVDGPEELRRHLREEMRTHLEELMEDSIRDGLSPDEAATRAIESFGELDAVREGLESVHGRRHLAFLVEKAMDWKENTMKTTWKWSSTATMLLMTDVALLAALIGFWIVFLVPKVEELATRSAASQSFAHSTLQLAKFAERFGGYILILAAIAWVLFEWRIKSESKALIRLTAGIAVTMVLVIVAGWISTGCMISFCLLAATAAHP